MSTFGSIYRVTTFGESHCKGVGVIIDNCPPGLVLSEADVQPQLTRRRPGQSDLTTPRNESDSVTIYSGVEKGVTLGTPIMMLIPNRDQRPHDYGEMDLFPRPSHADLTYLLKYGVKASSGGGRSSARETIGRVAASAVAEKYLGLTHGIEIVAFVSAVGGVSMEPMEDYPEDANKEVADKWIEKWNTWWSFLKSVKRTNVDSNEVRCPDMIAAARMRERIVKAKDAQDSIGGVVTCVIRNLPVGLGEPCFDKLEAKLAHAMLSIPASKAFEVGSGMAGTKIPGHVHNDPFVLKEGGKMGTSSNFSGGIQGGISNGEDVYFKVAFKSVATIGQAQETSTYGGREGILEAKGRHDPCVLPRAVPIVESMATLVVMDMLLLQMSRSEAKKILPRDQIPSVLKAELEKELK